MGPACAEEAKAKNITATPRVPWSKKWQPTPNYCLGNSLDRGVWKATVIGVAKSRTLLSARVRTHAYTHTHTRTHAQNTLAPAKMPSEAISKSHLDKVPACEIHVRHDSGKP